MGPKENTPLLGRPDFSYIRINVSDDPKRYKRQELTQEDLEYYTAHPWWIKVRLVLFWSFWLAFLVVMVLSVMIYNCMFPDVCS